MSKFGKLQFVGLDRMPEGGAPSFRMQVADGQRRDGLFSRFHYLARANLAFNYIHWLRRRSNHPAFIARAAGIEKWLYAPFQSSGVETERARSFMERDYHLSEAMIAPALVEGLRGDIFAEQDYYDPYLRNARFLGPPEEIAKPMLYMQTARLFENRHFLEICANEDLIGFCREVLGPAAALSWAWAWISNPGHDSYQNQNWHRDSLEPLNFIRVFVPLTPIRDELDGPTVLIPATSRHAEFHEVRRYSDAELSDLQARNGVGMIPAEPGDVYFVNTFALHRGQAPLRRRALLTLLVSLSPSHRTPTIRKIQFKDLPEMVLPTVRKHRRFFRHLVT